MKRITLFAGAMLLAIASFAQVSTITGTLAPASGNFYKGDMFTQGIIRANYTGQIDGSNAVATISATGYAAVTATIQAYYEEIWIEAEAALNSINVADETPFTLTITNVKETNDVNVLDVANLTGSYTYRHTSPFLSTTPASGDTLASKTATVEFYFNQNIGYTSIQIESGSVITPLAKINPVATGDGRYKVSVPVLESYWGTTQDLVGRLPIVVTLVGAVDADGTGISNAYGMEKTITETYYVVYSPESVTYLGADADPYWTLAQDLFDYDITFSFSNPVVMTNTAATAVFNYYNEQDEVIETISVPMDSIVAQLSPRGNAYCLYVPVYRPSATTEADMLYMTIDLQGITYNNNPVTLASPLLQFFTVFPEEEYSMRAPATKGDGGGGTTGIESDKVDVNRLINIYSIQGILLKKNVPTSTVNTLSSGLYIVDGQKVFVNN